VKAATAAAGVLGTAVVFALAFGLARSLARSSPRTDPILIAEAFGTGQDSRVTGHHASREHDPPA
jgi:hypothetical protein